MSLRGELQALFGSPRETHPIPDAPDLPLPDRVHHLEQLAAQLWDQVWWLSLPWWKRAIYRARGFRDPIASFYTSRP